MRVASVKILGLTPRAAAVFCYTKRHMSSEAPHGHGHEKAEGHAEKHGGFVKQAREKLWTSFKSLVHGGVISSVLAAGFVATTGVVIPMYMVGTFAAGFAFEDILNGSSDHKKAPAHG